MLEMSRSNSTHAGINIFRIPGDFSNPRHLGVRVRDVYRKYFMFMVSFLPFKYKAKELCRKDFPFKSTRMSRILQNIRRIFGGVELVNDRLVSIV